MARRPRLYGKEIYHHIYAWGNNRQAIFITDEHYTRYLDFLERFSRDCRVDIVAYALMPTHIHLFVYDPRGKVSQFMNNLHGEYAQYFNQVTGRVGHVFGERFNNKVVQANEYGLWLSRYIHRQAVEAGFVTDPRYYPWTSYHRYLGEIPLGFLEPDIILEQFGMGCERTAKYEEFVLATEHGPIDWGTKSTMVVGDEGFQQEVVKQNTTENQKNFDDREIFQLISSKFKVKPKLLFSARGLGEKRLRREIIRFLTDEIGLQPSRIAKLCHISRSGVQRALSTKVQKCMPVPIDP